MGLAARGNSWSRMKLLRLVVVVTEGKIASALTSPAGERVGRSAGEAAPARRMRPRPVPWGCSLLRLLAVVSLARGGGVQPRRGHGEVTASRAEAAAAAAIPVLRPAAAERHWHVDFPGASRVSAVLFSEAGLHESHPATVYAAAGACVHALNAQVSHICSLDLPNARSTPLTPGRLAPSPQDGRPLWQFCDPGGTELVTPPLLVVPRGQPPAADSPVLLQRLLVAGARHLSVLNANAGAGGAKATLLAAAPTPRAPPLSINALIALTRWCGWLRSIIRCSRERRGRWR
eukprot:COSAG06_NODE_2918_length_6095_cov_510.475150_2_plen_289_part_00